MYDVQNLVVGPNTFEGSSDIRISFDRPVVGDMIINGRIVGSDRPEHSSGGFALFLGSAENILTMDEVVVPLPGSGITSGNQLHVGENSVSVRIHTGHHGHMCRESDGRINGRNMGDSCATAQIFFEIRECLEVVQVLPYHGIG